MRQSRQSKILELIRTQNIDTQDRLAAKLNAAGFKVTQATVSRDIKELGLIKVPGQGGRSVYALAPKGSPADEERFRKILRDTVTEIKAAENILVIKTLSGCANAAAEAIDNLSPDSVVGTLAGDNTIFAAIDSMDNVPAVLELFTEAIR